SVIVGGAGYDSVSFNASTATEDLTLNLSTGEGLGASWTGIEEVSGTLGSGNDFASVGAAFSNLNGGLGNDTLVLDYSSGTPNPDFQITHVYLQLAQDGSLNSQFERFYYTTSEGVSSWQNFRLEAFENFSITATNGNDAIYLKDGDDQVFGLDGNDAIYSGGGNDLLDGGQGADNLSGGAGIDTLSYQGSALGVSVRLQGYGSASETQYAFGGDAEGDILSGFENVLGSSQNDDLIGSMGGNIIEGGLGNDVIRGRGGADILDGGEGIDTLSYQGSAQGVFVRLQGYGEFSDSQYAFGGDAEGDTLSGFENVVGSGRSDDIIGSDSANNIAGGFGNDLIRGRGGADILDGGAGIDTLSYQGSAQGVSVRLQGYGEFSDIQYAFGGDAEGDVLSGFENIIGSGRSDDLIGSMGNNVIEGGFGNDVIRGRGGADILDGGAGIDTLSYQGSAQGVFVRLQGYGELSDTQYAFGGDAEGDILSGFENVIGSGRNDDLIGSLGDNIIEGGAGNDKLRGRSGDDTFVFKANSDNDTIVDWKLGDDIIDLRSLNTNWSTISSSLTQDGNDTIIDLGGGNSIRLTNILASSLEESDFLFGSQASSSSARTTQQISTTAIMVSLIGSDQATQTDSYGFIEAKQSVSDLGGFEAFVAGLPSDLTHEAVVIESTSTDYFEPTASWTRAIAHIEFSEPMPQSKESRALATDSEESETVSDIDAWKIVAGVIEVDQFLTPAFANLDGDHLLGSSVPSTNETSVGGYERSVDDVAEVEGAPVSQTQEWADLLNIVQIVDLDPIIQRYVNSVETEILPPEPLHSRSFDLSENIEGPTLVSGMSFQPMDQLEPQISQES
uniref:calcium-binding protein n=1 Tax=uncultured Altererythrobacter sp. TaxID=500840 RepID=UPI00261EC2F3